VATTSSPWLVTPTPSNGSSTTTAPAGSLSPTSVGRQTVENAVSRAVEVFGRIDVVANNAGYGVFGGVEESTDEQARGIFDTNVFGVLNVLRATLPVLRAQRGGDQVRIWHRHPGLGRGQHVADGHGGGVRG
jgi:NAD(P)-dependent dehydrogenase (short-subunit alcohol dehydrogenase family)